jgi:hypothetical protein
MAPKSLVIGLERFISAPAESFDYPLAAFPLQMVLLQKLAAHSSPLSKGVGGLQSSTFLNQPPGTRALPVVEAAEKTRLTRDFIVISFR